MVKRANFHETGEWIDDADELKRLASKHLKATATSQVAFKTRSAFLADLVASKHEANCLEHVEVVTGKAQDLNKILQDTGVYLFPKLRMLVASEKIEETGDSFVDDRAKYLLPLPKRAEGYAGSCEANERNRMRSVIKTALANQKAANDQVQRQQDPDAVEDDEDDPIETEGCAAPIYL